MIKVLMSNIESVCIHRYFIWLLFISVFCSCTTTRSLTYFQGKNDTDSKRYSTLATIEPIPVRIQPDDILAIVVGSLSEESNALFNLPNSNDITSVRFPGTSSVSGGPLGYLVDQDGEVSLPLVGKIRLAGMTLKEADNSVKEHLIQFIKDPSVNVRLLNQKFTVIGEVSRPGIYNLLSTNTTLPDVLGMAGDLTLYGRRDNVMLIRTVNNRREVIKLDLTSRQVLNSPYYFIENNDVVYVESRPGKITSTDRTLQLLPTVLTITSTFILLANFLLR